MQLKDVHVGLRVRIVGNSCSHSYAIGHTLVISRIAGDHLYSTGNGCYFLPEDVIPMYEDRAEEASFLLTSVLPLKVAQMEEITKEVEGLRLHIENLQMYPSIEDELAAKIVAKAGPESALSADTVATLLRDMKLTEQIKTALGLN